jgi:hypothetical protein
MWHSFFDSWKAEIEKVKSTKKSIFNPLDNRMIVCTLNMIFWPLLVYKLFSFYTLIHYLISIFFFQLFFEVILYLFYIILKLNFYSDGRIFGALCILFDK